MSELLVVDAGVSAEPVHSHPLIAAAADVADIYDLPSLDLRPYAGLVLTAGADQRFLDRHCALVRGVLDRGGVVVWSGHLCRSWLPGAGLFVPRPIGSFRDYAVRLVTPHPVFEGVEEHDLTFRRGVAGFFARGHHPPPPGAVILAELPGSEPAVWVDTRTTSGTVLAHAGGDLLGYVWEESSAARLVPQLFAWMRNVGRR
jgi:hypothetical protein